MNLINIFKETLELSKKYFRTPASKYYKEYNMKIVWSNNTIDSIFAEDGHIAALNFADDKIPGGLVWQGAETQEECLCRTSNLYSSLVEHEKDYYNDNGGLIYSKDVIFFRNSEYKLVKPKKCDIITCAALVGVREKFERLLSKMQMIIGVARLNGVETLILGKWGCGAFGGDWEVYKKCWCEVIGESEIDI